MTAKEKIEESKLMIHQAVELMNKAVKNIEDCTMEEKMEYAKWFLNESPLTQVLSMSISGEMCQKVKALDDVVNNKKTIEEARMYYEEGEKYKNDK